ncbi:trehalose-phosphatase [Pontibacter sp. MBLB2868]|uniref:trehalose-phosphatase n=1 Tax=Pontibacter sp. MBLB2868 TaxID=3451555 RepID=UPI003F74FB07
MQENINDLLDQKHIKALILDMDGVITQTALVHAKAWKRMFDDYLGKRGNQEGKAYKQLDIATDYRQYIDGIPRYDGVRNYLSSRGVVLPEGLPGDAPGKETVAGLGNLKNAYFQELVKKMGVEVYPDTISWLKQQRSSGRKTAVISASKNCKAILAAAGIEYLFDALVDGVEAVKLGLKGKPAPDVFLAAANLLGVAPTEAAIFEDALAGVSAGQAGGFSLVVGIDRADNKAQLLNHGADVVINKFPTIQPMKNQSGIELQKREARELPSAQENLSKLLNGKKPAVFLDYDGCLTPIVKDPDKAILSPEMRATLRRLAEACPVAVVSGRDRADVEKLVQLQNLYFAGSHGFDISGPGNMHIEPGGAKDALPALEEADAELKERLKTIEGALVERKRYAIAVHYRNVPDEKVEEVKRVTADVLQKHRQLKEGLGKKIIELKPNLDWHKGKAVLWLMQELDLNKPDIIPIYIGDDITDEDAFDTLQGQGVGILVGEHDEKTAATYRLEDVNEVQKFLETLTQVIYEKQQHA